LWEKCIAGRTYLERETGVEPATSSLARKHSTTELLPLFTGLSIAAKFRVVNARYRLTALSSEVSVHGEVKMCISIGDGLVFTLIAGGNEPDNNADATVSGTDAAVASAAGLCR
jgi:hypothetical protein